MRKISDIESLPLRQNKTKFHGRHYRYRGVKSPYHPVKGIWPYTRVARICQEFTDKSFDDAFAKYCKQVPKHQQYIFLEYFDTKKWSNWEEVNGIIKSTKEKRPQKVMFRSIDFKSEYTYETYTYERGGKKYTSTRYAGYKVIEGWEKEFSSRFDPEYRKLFCEKQSKLRKQAREKALEDKNHTYCFLTKEEKERKATEEDIMICNRHGFTTDSFKGDPYHGQQRKKKNNSQQINS